MPCIQSTWWCFTLNNPDAFRPGLTDTIQYICYQLETGSQGTPHLQGVVQMKRFSTLKMVKTAISDKIHAEKMMAKNPEDAISYCRKEEGRLDGPWEYGEYIKKGSNKRKRSDELMDEYRTDPEGMMLADPDTYNRIMMKELNDQFTADKTKGFKHMVKRRWQQLLEDCINEEADDRHIIWCYGARRNE